MQKKDGDQQRQQPKIDKEVPPLASVSFDPGIRASMGSSEFVRLCLAVDSGIAQTFLPKGGSVVIDIAPGPYTTRPHLVGVTIAFGATEEAEKCKLQYPFKLGSDVKDVVSWLQDEVIAGLQASGGRLAGLRGFLVPRVQDSEETVNLQRITNLEKMGGESVITRLIELLDTTSNYTVRNHIAISLGKMEASAAIPHLVGLIEDPKMHGKEGSLVYALSKYQKLPPEVFLSAARWLCERGLEPKMSSMTIIENQGKLVDASVKAKARDYLIEQLDHLRIRSAAENQIGWIESALAELGEG